MVLNIFHSDQVYMRHQNNGISFKILIDFFFLNKNRAVLIYVPV